MNKESYKMVFEHVHLRSSWVVIHNYFGYVWKWTKSHSFLAYTCFRIICLLILVKSFIMSCISIHQLHFMLSISWFIFNPFSHVLIWGCHKREYHYEKITFANIELICNYMAISITLQLNCNLVWEIWSFMNTKLLYDFGQHALTSLYICNTQLM